jgi:hypothetical protein
MCSIAKQYFRMLDKLQEPLAVEAQIAKLQPLHETPRCIGK